MSLASPRSGKAFVIRVASCPEDVAGIDLVIAVLVAAAYAIEFFIVELALVNRRVLEFRSHSDLTDDYVAVPSEMKQVAAYFGREVLREVDETAFFKAIPALHGRCSDRAILRAMHFFGENSRAIAEADALDRGDVERFFTLYRQSADSSANLLQNLYAAKKPAEQGIPLAIAVSKSVLGHDANVRVHGGGFAGTIQAFVPLDKTEAYREKMDALFGAGSCYVLRIRPVGGVKLV